MSSVSKCLVYVILAMLCMSVHGHPLHNDENKLYFGGGADIFQNVSSKIYEEKQVVAFSKDSLGQLNSAECTLCKYAMNIVLWKYKTPNRNYSKLFQFIMQACIGLHIEQTQVCTGIVKAMENETQYLFHHINVTGEILCDIILSDQCNYKDLSWNSNKWTVPLPKQDKHRKPRNHTSTKTLRVLQISDLHTDLKYTPGSKVNCNEPLCCRQPAQHGDILAGYWGSLGYCDVPFWTVENFLQHVSKEKFDYIVWTGDLPAHDVWNQSRSEQEYLLKNLTSLLLHYFPNTPIYPALGNHESYPVNSFPPKYVVGYDGIGWLYDSLVKAWSPWLPTDALKTVKESGYYTVLVQPGLRLISLNMNYCNNQNFWMLVNPIDPNGELKWLVDTLHEAEKNGELVHIIGHIPPTIGGDCLKVWRNNYYDIVIRFKDVIRGQFFGHTHADQFEIIYTNSSKQQPVSVAYISPSITTYSNLNPGYRIYDIDGQSWNILDHHTYILNLTKANKQGSKPVWEYEYSARKAYNLTSLLPSNWDQLYKNWAYDDSAVTLQRYYRYYNKGNPPLKSCDFVCRQKLLCEIAGGNFTDPRCS